MKQPLDQALDKLTEGRGRVEVDTPTGRATVDVVDVDRIGVRVRRVRVHRDEPFDIAREAATIGDRLRALPDRVVPVEVDPRLGGAVLRTRPDEVREREYFEVELDGTNDIEARRVRAREGGGREGTDWAMTRDQLGRLVDELG